MIVMSCSGPELFLAKTVGGHLKFHHEETLSFKRTSHVTAEVWPSAMAPQSFELEGLLSPHNSYKRMHYVPVKRF